MWCENPPIITILGENFEVRSIEQRFERHFGDLEPTIEAEIIAFSTNKTPNLYSIKKVIFNDPATIVMWEDGTKTVVKCQPEDYYDKVIGLLLCMAKKMYGNNGKFNDILNKWCPEEDEYGPGMTEEEWDWYETYMKSLCEFLLGRKA